MENKKLIDYTQEELVVEFKEYGFTEMEHKEYKGDGAVTHFMREDNHARVVIIFGRSDKESTFTVFATSIKNPWIEPTYLFKGRNADTFKEFDYFLVEKGAYARVDSIMYDTQKIHDLTHTEVLVPTKEKYYNSYIMKDSWDNTYKAGAMPSPYRNFKLKWFPVIQDEDTDNWKLKNTSNEQDVLVNPTNIVNTKYGDFIITLPK